MPASGHIHRRHSHLRAKFFCLRIKLACNNTAASGKLLQAVCEMAASLNREITWQVQLSQYISPSLFPRDHSRFRPLKAAQKGRAIPGSRGWWLKSNEAMTLTLTRAADHGMSTLSVVAAHVYEHHNALALSVTIPMTRVSSYGASPGENSEIGTVLLISAPAYPSPVLFALRFKLPADASRFLKELKSVHDAQTEHIALATRPPQPEKAQPSSHLLPSIPAEEAPVLACATSLESRVKAILEDPSFPEYFARVEKTWDQCAHLTGCIPAS